VTFSGAAAASSSPARGPVLMSIGEVLAHLRGEFPDITISKLRFLEGEGLVEPRRTPAGYRKYTPEDVARLRFVLSAQRDRYLPLRVIREQLDAGPPATGVGPAAEPVDQRLSRADVLAQAALTEELLDDLERHGLVRPRHGRYDAAALEVARTAARLAEYGLEARHLRGYRTAADREVGLLTQLVAPLARQNTPAARTRAVETVREVAALSEQLHAALVRAGVREALGQ
jgi:DNA-binding transcriptional MerR regulator